MAVRHHDLCFGCGVANVFGLQMEVERVGEGRVAGRFFVKQDHQGPPNVGHGGVLGAALDEAMALCVHAEGMLALTRRLEVDLLGPAPVGEFVEVEASVDGRDGRKLVLTAVARVGGSELARARGLFVEVRREGFEEG